MLKIQLVCPNHPVVLYVHLKTTREWRRQSLCRSPSLVDSSVFLRSPFCLFSFKFVISQSPFRKKRLKRFSLDLEKTKATTEEKKEEVRECSITQSGSRSALTRCAINSSSLLRSKRIGSAAAKKWGIRRLIEGTSLGVDPVAFAFTGVAYTCFLIYHQYAVSIV